MEKDRDVRVDTALISESYSSDRVTPRFYAVVMTLFALLALLIASVGLYGMVSHSVAQRTKEIGVRMALGADATRIRRLVVSDALISTGAGGAIGLISSFWLARALASMLHETQAHDLLSFGLAIVVLVLVAAVAAVLPTQRATRLDPVVTLKVD